jgi:hypothetical protein
LIGAKQKRREASSAEPLDSSLNPMLDLERASDDAQCVATRIVAQNVRVRYMQLAQSHEPKEPFLKGYIGSEPGHHRLPKLFPKMLKRPQCL